MVRSLDRDGHPLRGHRLDHRPGVACHPMEAVLEVLFYHGRLGYAGEPERWAAFGRAMAAATPAYWGAIALCVRASKLHAS
jgi:hypothetical protein